MASGEEDLLAHYLRRVDEKGRHTFLTKEGEDDWVHWMGRAVINPFPNARQKFKLQLLSGTWTSRMELLGTQKNNEVWGIQAWETYKAENDQAPVFESDKDIQFFLPTFQWWYEFPFRILSAPVVAALKKPHNNLHHRVFVTWGDGNINREMDQYIIYINRKTGLIDRIEYTIREMGAFAKGATTFLEYRLVDEVNVPYQLEASVIMPGGMEQVMHRVTLHSASWDLASHNKLLAKPGLVSEKGKKL